MREPESIQFRGGIWPLVVFTFVMALLHIGLFRLVGRLLPGRSPWLFVGPAKELGARAYPNVKIKSC